MCDFSLQNVRSRKAAVGDKLVSRDFGTGTRGLSTSHDAGLAVCVLPGTEIAFDQNIRFSRTVSSGYRNGETSHRTAIFRQVNKGQAAAHHDALELPDGRLVLLTLLDEGQAATVLQLPADPATLKNKAAQDAARADQERVAYVG